jgi:hypothetical protein
MSTQLQALAAYVEVLSASAAATQHSNDRPEYTKRLASAARIFLLLHQGRQAEAIQLVAEERRAYGWSYLSGAPGAAAAIAFSTFAATLDANAI